MYKFLYIFTFVGVTARTHILFIVLWTHPHKVVKHIFIYSTQSSVKKRCAFYFETKSLLHTFTETFTETGEVQLGH